MTFSAKLAATPEQRYILLIKIKVLCDIMFCRLANSHDISDEHAAASVGLCNPKTLPEPLHPEDGHRMLHRKVGN
jgi:hypothetical protein